ncbi:MAG: UDP-N-acetylmuramoyl-tripeptide--D-alanyl-D-alanine ligase [Candidatus Magasanikbacteria bacterium]|nr:UDP-N-acetylmuramoyl-tripeptide--D-alanyl-D-alanine ligase [Candidatus Magasanikbacteria bacterium]
MKFWRAPYRAIQYHLYLLQLENYELSRFWQALSGKGVLPPRAPFRKRLIITPKLAAVGILGIILQAGFAALVAVIFAGWQGWGSAAAEIFFIVVFTLLSWEYAIFATGAVGLIIPWDRFIKFIIVNQARRRLARVKPPIIVGIAGSYGKTTMKEVIGTVLKGTRQVLVTPENINTPLGIARLINRRLSANTEVLVAEMGEYYRGDIAEICKLTPPTVAVITGINEAHRERLRSAAAAAETIFEAVEQSTPDALVVLNADDELVRQATPRWVKDRRVVWYSAYHHPLAAYQVGEWRFDPAALTQHFTLQKEGEAPLSFTTKLLGRYVIGNAMAGLIIAEQLGLPRSIVPAALAALPPLPHRLEPRYNAAMDIVVIDDTYNGNPAGAREAFNLLQEFSGRRKLIITPGLVEMGSETERVHSQLGEAMARAADEVLLIKNSVTPFLAEGLRRAGHLATNIHWFNSAPEAHAAIVPFLKRGDVILFQNDWPDNYA